MQVQTINTYNNLTFGAIYKPKNLKFNKVQEPISEAIMTAMRKPLQKFKGATAEDFYKSKGYDFEITPHSENSVYLTAYKNMREIGTGKDRGLTYSDFVNIGEYDKDSEFRVPDIETGLEAKRFSDTLLSIMFAAAVLAMAVIGLTKVKSSSGVKPMTEFVDSVANNVKTVLSDTTKVLKTIKK
ncbi:MAG: hypothetical protein ACI37Q_06365 [Candidatus Gastranaerophilaceae bacterium]